MNFKFLKIETFKLVLSTDCPFFEINLPQIVRFAKKDQQRGGKSVEYHYNLQIEFAPRKNISVAEAKSPLYLGPTVKSIVKLYDKKYNSRLAI